MKFGTIVTVLTFLFFTASAQAKPKGVELGEAYLHTENKVTCGYNSKKGVWKSGKVNKKGKFLTYAALAKAARKAGNSAKAAKLLKKGKKGNKSVCRGLDEPNTALDSLDKLPDSSEIFSSKSKSKKSKKAVLAAMLGALDKKSAKQAPILSKISDLEIKNLFWREGLVDEINNSGATPELCDEFFGGDHNGESGGFGACMMTQGVGFSFEHISRSGKTLCYLKNIPTEDNVESGGVGLISGSLPDGDVSKLFVPPTGEESRLVKIDVRDDVHNDPGKEDESPETFGVFIDVKSANTNSTNQNQYAVDLWFCNGDQATPEGYEQITIDSDGVFTSVNAEDSDMFGKHSALVQGSLSLDKFGNYIFDNTKSRTALVEFNELFGDNPFKFKANIQIQGNTITSKTNESFGKSYTVANFSGQGLEDLRFLEGASKSNFGHGEDHVGATKFKKRYVNAPDSALLATANAVNFETDSFYSSLANPSVDTSGFDCTTTPDVAVYMDFANKTVQKSVRACEGDELQNMDFCWNDQDVSNAEMNCHGGF